MRLYQVHNWFQIFAGKKNIILNSLYILQVRNVALGIVSRRIEWQQLTTLETVDGISSNLNFDLNFGNNFFYN